MSFCLKDTEWLMFSWFNLTGLLSPNHSLTFVKIGSLVILSSRFFFNCIKLKVLALISINVYTFPIMPLFKIYTTLWASWTCAVGLQLSSVDWKFSENVWRAFYSVSTVLSDFCHSQSMILEFCWTSLSLNFFIYKRRKLCLMGHLQPLIYPQNSGFTSRIWTST